MIDATHLVIMTEIYASVKSMTAPGNSLSFKLHKTLIKGLCTTLCVVHNNMLTLLVGSLMHVAV